MKILATLIIFVASAVMGGMDNLVTWRRIPAWVESITANDKDIYATNGVWQLFRCRRPCLRGEWEFRGWFAGKVAANKWEVWVLASNGRIYRSKAPVHQWKFLKPGNGWSLVDGVLRQVSLGTNMVAGVNYDSDAFMSPWDFTKKSQSQANWRRLPGKWKKVSASADNQLWGVSTDGHVFKYRKRKQKWRKIPNPVEILFNSISVGRKYVYATAADNTIYRCTRPCKFGGWQLIPNMSLQDVTGENTADDNVLGINKGNAYIGSVKLI